MALRKSSAQLDREIASVLSKRRPAEIKKPAGNSMQSMTDPEWHLTISFPDGYSFKVWQFGATPHEACQITEYLGYGLLGHGPASATPVLDSSGQPEAREAQLQAALFARSPTGLMAPKVGVKKNKARKMPVKRQ